MGYVNYFIQCKFRIDMLLYAHPQEIMYIISAPIAFRIIGETEYIFRSQSRNNLCEQCILELSITV